MRCIVIVAVMALAFSSCSKVGEVRNAAVEKMVEQAAKKGLGHGASATVSPGAVTIRHEGKEYTISIKGAGGEETKNGVNYSLPMAPQSTLAGYVPGIDKYTMVLRSRLSLADVEKFYRDTLPGKGFGELSFMRGDAQFSGLWAKAGKDMVVSVYAFVEAAGSRIFIMLTRDKPA